MNPERRRKGQQKARRVLRIWRSRVRPENSHWFTNDSPIAQTLRSTRAPCSRPCCGNPRKWYGRKARDERREDEAFDSWIKYEGIGHNELPDAA